ncbi:MULTISPECIES: hypothetical protein [unclassified Sphingobium]|uniref:hypothetical protein n=1 Tax=unclassified Sphingobium TaxID=2611147 RepID=UPI00257D8F53|nr:MULTISPECIES: hypothetical protein [unclassified Sphingobium]
MTITRFGAPGQDRPVLIDDAGQVRDLSAHIKTIDVALATPQSAIREGVIA